MKLSQHANHRNAGYLKWLRQRKCIVSGQKAECAHHIRLGTNGGTSLKPSDYFCIPLLNEYHVSGPTALHIIGEETFLEQFKLCPVELFIKFLKEYLIEKYEIYYMLEGRSNERIIADLIELAENKLPKLERPKRLGRKKTSKRSPTIKSDSPRPSITENEHYQRAKELKRERDKELRKKLKSRQEKSPKPLFKGNELYEQAKEKRKLQEKEFRKKNKERLAKYRKEQREKYLAKREQS